MNIRGTFRSEDSKQKLYLYALKAMMSTIILHIEMSFHVDVLKAVGRMQISRHEIELIIHFEIGVGT